MLTSVARVLNPKPPSPSITYTDPVGRVTVPDPPAQPIAVATLQPAVAEGWERIARVKACPHWTKSTDCGCGTNRCALGRGDRGMVGYVDCFECADLPPATG